MKNSAARKLKQVPAGYLIVGVDSHNKKHAAVAINEDLVVQTKSKFVNCRNGFDEALEKARVEMVKAGCRATV